MTFPERHLPAAIVRISACFLVILSCSALLLGRDRPKPSDYAVIFGTVWGPDDHPIPGIKVQIRRAEDKKARGEKYSNRLGEFEFYVPAGKHDYVVSADTKGYKFPNGARLQAPEVTVHVQNNEREDTGLHLK